MCIYNLKEVHVSHGVGFSITSVTMNVAIMAEPLNAEILIQLYPEKITNLLNYGHKCWVKTKWLK